MKARNTSLIAVFALLAALFSAPAVGHAQQAGESQATSSSAIAQQLGPSEATLRRLGRPLVIGVAGDSGSGKTTVAKDLKKKFGADRAIILSTDDWHSLDRKQRAEKKVTALNPVATDFKLLARHLATLREGKPITKPIYDHSDGTIKKNAERVEPRPIIIVEGLHPLQNPDVLKQLDYKIYVSPSKEVKDGWKIQRDVKERGHSEEAVRKSIEERQPDFQEFIEPQRQNADLVVEYEAGESLDKPLTYLVEKGKKKGKGGKKGKRTRVRGGKSGMVSAVAGRIAGGADLLAKRARKSSRNSQMRRTRRARARRAGSKSSSLVKQLRKRSNRSKANRHRARGRHKSPGKVRAKGRQARRGKHRARIRGR